MGVVLALWGERKGLQKDEDDTYSAGSGGGGGGVDDGGFGAEDDIAEGEGV